MATLINLRQVRKVRAREEQAAKAAEQRTRHGRSRAERQAVDDRLAREAALLSGHQLEAVETMPADALDQSPPVMPR